MESVLHNIYLDQIYYSTTVRQSLYDLDEKKSSHEGHKEIVKVLLNNKADPNICYVGSFPLYIASLQDHTEIVKALLNNKADPNICCVGIMESFLHNIY
jgi:hypothetical protein